MISKDISSAPYAIFGHSMGCILGYEVAYKLRENSLPAPKHLFFSGRGAPDFPIHNDDIYHHLPDDEFKEKILQLGGTPKEFFQHPELLEVLLPMLKSDFRIAETYVHTSEIIPFEQAITVFIGKDEPVESLQIESWKKHSMGVCSIHFFPGGHFFINEYTRKVVQIINNRLLDES